ncbi:MAG: ABC transporter substrate-binding protein, partial [Bacteroidetes bacterium]|nr:ABC transporter substrate-binding protein [Bacteroidota bacterium]
MHIYIGVDDTDSIGSRGTGFRCRQMGSELTLAGHGKVLGITRHQLFFHPSIPYTSQNSSNCLEVETPDMKKLWDFCKQFLHREAIDGSDVGLCVVESGQIEPVIENWGIRAKKEILTQDEAKQLARSNGVLLEGLTGTFDCIIGALAAVGLRKSGNDGRFIWQPGKQLRDLTGSMTIEQLLNKTQIDGVLTKEGKLLTDNEMIDLTDWVRAVLINKKTYILAEQNLKKS